MYMDAHVIYYYYWDLDLKRNCVYLGYNWCHLLHHSRILKEDFIIFDTTLIMPISEGGTNSWSMHYLAKSQSCWGLEFKLSGSKFTNTCSFTISFKKTNACFEVFVEWYTYLYGNTCLLGRSLPLIISIHVW